MTLDALADEPPQFIGRHCSRPLRSRGSRDGLFPRIGAIDHSRRTKYIP
jgi:hypothetical protein